MGELPVEPSSSGWSGIGGQTNLAYVLDRNPCGSSSGTGVAASADLATVGVGTETDGSIVCPSGANGIVGIKPTLGLLSRAGIVPISAEQDTAGPMTRNVTDAAVALGAMTGVDPTIRRRRPGRPRAHELPPVPRGRRARRRRIGVWRTGTYDPTVSPEIDALMNDTVAELEALGATVVDPVDGDIEAAYGPSSRRSSASSRTDIASYLETYTDTGYPKTLQDLIDFNKANPDLEGPWNSAIFDLAQATGGRGSPSASRHARRRTRSPARQSTTRWRRTTSTPSSPRRMAPPG